MKRVLMIAFHFPPLAGSSGVQRTLRFVQHLPGLGWEPLILTVNRGAYDRVSRDLEAEIPPHLVVRRALAFDAARQLSVRGRYPSVLARPDRWMTWQFDGARTGNSMLREFKPDAIWSTYPIATAHVIANKLHRRSGTPWIADFRDPMAQEGYPSDPTTWATFKRIEESTLLNAVMSVFTTPGCAKDYQARYPVVADRMRVIENGYDEESFSEADAKAAASGPLTPGSVTLLHSGIVYPSERDPRCLMHALGVLCRTGRIAARGLRVRFRAAVHDDLLLSLARENGVEDIVEVCPPIGYRDALAEMLRADGLLVLQASNCNEQIPAKLYEYFRARRPLLLLTDPNGDTAHAAKSAGVERVARLDNAEEIAGLLCAFVETPAIRDSLKPDDVAVRAASRRGRAEVLAALLDEASRLV